MDNFIIYIIVKKAKLSTYPHSLLLLLLLLNVKIIVAGLWTMWITLFFTSVSYHSRYFLRLSSV